MKGSNILLVDDEVVFTKNMSKLLTSRGYKVRTVTNGESAVEVLKEQSYDVVVLDLKMPGMSGIETLQKINELENLVEVLIITGHGSIDTAMEAIKLGAYDYLTKPCEIGEVVEKIEGAWKIKEDKKQKNMNEKIQKVVETPSSVFNLFPKE